MGKICRILLLALLLNTSLATMALARAVYLADGGIIQAQKVWKEEGRIYVLVNRDSLIHFAPEEINLKKTFAAQKAKAVAKAKVTPVAGAAPSAAPGAPAAATKATAVTAPAAPAAKGAAPVAAPVPAKAVSPPVVKKPVIAKKPAPPPPVEEETPLLALVALGGGLLFIVVLLASFWKVFVKAGEAGWKSLIPIYNLFVLLQIAGCPNWWLLMFFLPVVNIYFMVVMHIRLAEKFGKTPLFGFALCFLGFIFFPILAFGPATFGGGETFSFDEDEFAG